MFRYRITRLVYVERYSDVYEAIAREKQLKGWNRAWKIKLSSDQTLIGSISIQLLAECHPQASEAREEDP